jgi:hypothetical protein
MTDSSPGGVCAKPTICATPLDSPPGLRSRSWGIAVVICRGGLPRSPKVIVTLVEVAVDHDSSALPPLIVLRGRDSGLPPAMACAAVYSGGCLGKDESAGPA